MGFASMLLGEKNPFAQWVTENQNKIGAVGAGFAAGPDFGAGLSNAAQYAAQAAPLDATAALQRKAAAEQEKQQTATDLWMQNNYPQYVGLPGDMGIKLALAAEEQKQKPQGGDGFTLGEGQIRYDASGNPIAQGPTAQPEMQPGMMLGPDGKTHVPVPGGKEAFDRADALWKEYQAAEPVKSYQMVRNGYEKLRSASQLNNGAGDVSMIFAYMKMLDPTSVVREGEFGTAEQTGGIPSQISNLYNKLLNGERLTPEQRQQFVQAGDGLYQEAQQNLTQANEQYGGRAKTWGVDPSGIVTAPETYAPLTFGAPKTKTIGGKTFVQDANGDWYEQ